jgi:hypothetical protein
MHVGRHSEATDLGLTLVRLLATGLPKIGRAVPFLHPVLRLRTQMMNWITQRGLTLALFGAFLLLLGAQTLSGRADHNEERVRHGAPPLTLREYMTSGHMWEATFENWESEFLQMAAFVMLTVFLYQRGSPESRRPYAVEESDADPRRFSHLPDVPWPVRRGGWVLWLYEYSLGLAFVILFAVSWVGHAIGGWRAYQAEEVLEGRFAPALDPVGALLVRIAPELAERIPRDRRHGLALRLPASPGIP